ncbi:MAG: class I SAM-dependent methyltransferase [Candidatus Omnitrophica bacterium]|nr:class I SAM-dependent methyltransferase [Candidatus Omnitrophota bacterium]
MRLIHKLKSTPSIPHSGADYERMADRERALWGVEKGGRRLSWFDSPLLARYINRWITGSPKQDWLDYVKIRCAQKPAPRGLNVGCGQGELERLIIRRRVAECMDGFDISPAAVEIARKKADEEGFGDRIHYFTADANAIEQSNLPRDYDIVFASMSLHHFVRLEHCLDHLNRRLAPRGLLIVNEFVGPDRFQWTGDQLNAVNRLLDCFPRELKANLRNPGEIKNRVVRPSLKYMKEHMAFEAVCSQRILPALRERFHILEQRDYGGTVLQLLFEAIMGNFDEEECREHAVLVQMAAVAEELLLKSGALPHDHTLIIARKKS